MSQWWPQAEKNAVGQKKNKRRTGREEGRVGGRRRGGGGWGEGKEERGKKGGGIVEDEEEEVEKCNILLQQGLEWSSLFSSPFPVPLKYGDNLQSVPSCEKALLTIQECLVPVDYRSSPTEHSTPVNIHKHTHTRERERERERERDLAILTGLNPMRTGVNSSGLSRQYCSCPATNGACGTTKNVKYTTLWTLSYSPYYKIYTWYHGA